jgi:hypothetical protein
VKPLILPCMCSCCHSETVISPHPPYVCQFSVYAPTSHVHSIQCIPCCLAHCSLFFWSYSHLDCVTRRAYWYVGLHCLSSVSNVNPWPLWHFFQSFPFTVMFNTFWFWCSPIIKNEPKALGSFTHWFICHWHFSFCPALGDFAICTAK